MNIAFYIALGTTVLLLAVLFWVYSLKRTADSQLLLARQQLTQEQEKAQQLLNQLDAANDEARSLGESLSQTHADLAAMRARLTAEEEKNSRETQLRQEQFQQQLKTVQEQFGNLATHILDRTSTQLKSTNDESMRTLTAPLQQHIEQLRQEIQSTNRNTSESTATLKAQLEQMSRETNVINQTAMRLANVIKGNTKGQGNWGEHVLTDILQNFGMQEGQDYELQQTLTDEHGRPLKNDESGRTMIPDVIIHYPQGEDLIVDAKMTADAYRRYLEVETDIEREQCAKELVGNIRAQVKKLADKDYSSYIRNGRQAVDFVVMFVPFEGALQLALDTDKRLWNDAFDRKVFLTSQQNFMIILSVIRIAWRQHIQSENQKKVYQKAEELLKRVGEFVKHFQSVGDDIQRLQNNYNSVINKASAGRQSITQKARELTELGVKESARHPLPPPETDYMEDDAQ